ncbi:MAG: response regulator [Gemmataceae bacterium]|nr:response regulator [Gemmataceae bacterium]
MPSFLSSSESGQRLFGDSTAGRRRWKSRHWLLPLLTGVLGLATTLLWWLRLDREQVQRIQRQVQAEAAQAQRGWQQYTEQQRTAIQDFLRRWPQLTPQQRQQEISRYVGQTPACLGVWRVDSEWTMLPLEVRATAAFEWTEVLQCEKTQAALRDPQQRLLVQPRSKGSSRRTLLLLIHPLPEELESGHLLAIYSLEDLLQQWVGRSLQTGFAVTVEDEEKVVFQWREGEREARPEWQQSLLLTWGDNRWRMTVWPTRDVLALEELSLPHWTLGVGLIMTLLLALVMHLALTASGRARALERENRQRQAAEAALRQSEQTYRTLVENLGQGVFWQDAQGRYVAVNGTFARWLGRPVEAILGAADEQLFPADRAARFAREFRQVLQDGTPVESEEAWETAQGRRMIRRMLTPVPDENGAAARGVLGICWDVTELRRLEMQLRQASKMDAIGQLAGGIAHDFNNLLTVIIGNLDLALANASSGREPADEKRSQQLQTALQAANRAAALTQRLLSFARNHQLDWRPVSLNSIIADVVEMLRRTIDPRIRIETACDPDLWPVRSDPNQLHQVLMNLCLNARDAITPPGVIRIETQRLPAGSRRREQGLQVAAGDFIRLSVSDTGCGMSEEVQARIFEPFFTTKEPGKGTGLGLAMVFAIVRQHGGWIECQSQLGQGTRFDIYLPRAPVSEQSATPAVDEDHSLAEDTPLPPPRRTPTVLVVDDEEMVRNLAKAALLAQGWQVLEAADGQQAVEVFLQQRQAIDVVVLDLTMPVMSGHEVFRQLREIDPQVKVIFASGYAEEQLEESERQAMADFIKKPYRPQEVVHAVKAVLKQRSAGETKTHSQTLPELSIPSSVPSYSL